MKTNSISAGRAVHARTIATTRHLSFRRAWLWTGFLAFAAIAFGPQPAQAAVTEAWVQRYSNVLSNTTDYAIKVVRDAAGDIIVTGTTSGGIPGTDLLTLKYSGADGSVLWQQRYNSPANGYDRPSALAVDGSGNVVVTGTSGNGTNDDYYTAKYAAADGALLWEKRYNGPANDNDGARAVAVDGSGNVVVTGYARGINSITDYYTAKYAAADGALVWEQRYNGPAKANSYDQASAVAVDGSGNVVVTGASWNSTNSDVYTAKYAAANGVLLWEKRYNGTREWDHRPALAMDGSGNVVVAGDFYTAKYAAADGALLWERRYNGPANGYDHLSALAVDGSGNVVVTGHSGNWPNRDFYTAKYAAADGALLWEQRYNGPANVWDSANAVAVDGSGNVVVTGYSDAVLGLAPVGGDYYTAKYAAADGVLLWERRYDRPANSFDFAYAVTVDATGNVVVTGQIEGDYYTAKYAAADGVLLWEQRYDGSAPSYGSARGVAVDGNGNVAVTGITYNHTDSSVSEGDHYTAKYAAADGALLWEKRHSNGTAFALKVDTSGNVVVMGTLYGTNFNSDYHYTAKYAAADGALLWEKRNSRGSTAVAVDGSGNVAVTGTSSNGTNNDYYTAKYAATDGALLWEKFYNGPANFNDEARAVAVDASGNVLVTGRSAGSGTITSGFTYDYYTAEYAAADGALLWERRVNLSIGATANTYHAIAVDGDGHAVVTANSSHGLSYAAKYAAASGALLWEQRDTRPGLDGNHALAVDSGGNVVVTGVGATGGGVLAPRYHHYIARYAAADGALLWEKRNDGESRAVAVDRSGNVVVTGWSYDANSNPSSSTAKYAAADGALLWEKRFDGSVGPSSYGLALSSNGTVFVTGTSKGAYTTVAYREIPDAVAIDLVPTGVRLRFTGVSGRSYNIERAPAVTGPWSTINTQTAPASGLLEYLDTNPPAAAAFYRTSEP